MADTTPKDGQSTPAEQTAPPDPKDADRNMREALGPEMGSDAVEAAGAVAQPQRNIVPLIVAAAVGILVLQIAAAFLFPPQNPEHPGEPYQYPADGMVGANIELPAPHVVYDFTPATPPSHDLVTFDPTISNTLFTAWIIMAIIVVLAFMMSRAIRVIPTGPQNSLEYVYESLANFATSLGGPQARKYIPIFASLFVFILFSNWSGLVPPVGRIHELRAPTSDVNTTIGLALFSFVLFQAEGVRALGARGYIGKFFSLRAFREEGFSAGLISLFVGFIEFLLEFVKPVTLAMRLFGNIYGGEVALGVITGLTIAIVPVFMVGLEFLLNFMQALIFSVLTLIFTIIAITPHEEHDEEDHGVPEGNIGPPVAVSHAVGAH